MRHIYYYNITYYCNNRCIFCFSNSTGENHNQIDYNDFCVSIDNVKPQKDDIVVLNGGEPTIHPAFYKILQYLVDFHKCKVVVYSNGVSIDVTQVPISNKLSFIIPLHGEETTHDMITRNRGSYRNTLSNMQKLQQRKIKVSVKFILNSALIKKDFSIKSFLEKVTLCPETIYIARLNETTKSKANQVDIIEYEALRNYLLKWNSVLQDTYSVKYLDIPFCCCFEDYKKIISMYEEDEPMFFFNDHMHNMIKKNYYREIMIGRECNICANNVMCKKMSNSYKTLCFDSKWKIAIE